MSKSSGMSICSFFIFSMLATTALADNRAASDHAPIGVMGDHLHDAGSWMIGYKYEYTSYGQTNIIQCFNEEPVGIQTSIYNAKKIKNNLQIKYQLSYTKSIEDTGELE